MQPLGLLGHGGREYAIARRLRTDCPDIKLVAMGNAHVFDANVLFEPVTMGDCAAVVQLCHRHRLTQVLVGGEAWLAHGVADALAAAGIACIGPSVQAARLETSKVFCRNVAAQLGIPQPRYHVVETVAALPAALRHFEYSLPVIKVSGLCAGKGVCLPESWQACESIAMHWLQQTAQPILLEERLYGEEASLFFACDGRHARYIGSARDYKRLHNDDIGPNTGGMGALAPHPSIDSPLVHTLQTQWVEPLLGYLQAEGCPYRGFLYLGIMLCDGQPYLIEINARLGDPETQALLPLLKPGAFCEYLEGIVDQRLQNIEHQALAALTPKPSCCAVAVVVAHPSYPGPLPACLEILHLPNLTAESKHSWVTISGLQAADADRWQIVGGRMLAVVGVGDSFAQARIHVYQHVQTLPPIPSHYRSDIAQGVSS